MNKYIKVLVKFINISWMTTMEYRVNFLVWVVVDLAWTIMDLVFFSAIISNTKTIGTWSYGEMLVLLGISRLMVVPVFSWMYQSFAKISELVNRGNLDLILTKPIDSQFMVSIRHFSFSILPSLVGGTIITIVGFRKLGFPPTPLQLGILLILLIVSTILMYGMYFSSVALSLYFGRLNNIHHIFTNLFDNAKYPPEIYPAIWQRIITTILPIGIMLIAPAGYLVSKTTQTQTITFFVASIFFLLLSRFIWQNGLRRYSSASS